MINSDVARLGPKKTDKDTFVVVVELYETRRKARLRGNLYTVVL